MNRHLVVWSSVFFVHSVVVAAVLPLAEQTRIIEPTASAVFVDTTYQTSLLSPVVWRRRHFPGDLNKLVELIDALYPPLKVDPPSDGLTATLHPPIRLARLDATAQHSVTGRTDAVSTASVRYQDTTPASLVLQESNGGPPPPAHTPIQQASLTQDVTPYPALHQLSVDAVTPREQPAEPQIAGFALDIAQLTPGAESPPAPPPLQPGEAPAPPPPQSGTAPAPLPPQSGAAPAPPQPGEAPAPRTKYVWRPREAISGLIPGFRLGRWEGKLEGYVDYMQVNTKNPNARQRNENQVYDARITLRNRGAYVIDPRLLRLTLGGTAGIIKHKFDFRSTGSVTSVTKDDDDGDLLGYDFLAEILPINSFSVDLFANRNRLTESGTLAGPLLTDISNAGVTVRARRFYIPSTLHIRTDRAETESGTAELVTSRRDERRNSITYDGRRGWLHRALQLRYRFLDKSDTFTPATDYRNHEARAFYTMDFGPELRKRWDSSVRVLDRTGLTDETRLDLDQLLEINHTDRLRTEYRYVGAFTDRPTGDMDNHNLSFLAEHHLYRNLRTTLQLGGSRDNFPDGKRDIRRGRLEFDYNKQLPRAQLFANVALLKRRQEDDFESTRVLVSREPHRFDQAFALPVSLAQPFVEPDSVSIIKTQNGPDVPGCGDFSVPRPLREGIDYTLRTVGALTEIVPIPCSLVTPGINPGDIIVVDYIATVSPDQGVETDGYEFLLAVEDRHFRPFYIRPFYRHDKTDENLISGFDPRILNDREAETFGVDVRYDTDIIRGQFQVEREDFKSRDQDYESINALLSLRYNYSRRWRFNLNGRARERQFSRPRDRQTDFWAIRAAVIYVRDANLRVELYGELRDLEDTLAPDEHHEEIGVRARWRLGKLDVIPTLRYIDRRRGETDLQDNRATLRVIRRF